MDLTKKLKFSKEINILEISSSFEFVLVYNKKSKILSWNSLLCHEKIISQINDCEIIKVILAHNDEFLVIHQKSGLIIWNLTDFSIKTLRLEANEIYGISFDNEVIFY